MSPDFKYNEFPAGFAHCFNKKCQRGATCLRHQVALRIPKKRACVYIVNPESIGVVTGEECTSFLLDKPQRYARGFTHLFDELPVQKADIIKSEMRTNLGRNTYYRCKEKTRLIKPKEQEYIQKLFLKQGIHTVPQFDEYVEYYDLG